MKHISILFLFFFLIGVVFGSMSWEFTPQKYRDKIASFLDRYAEIIATLVCICILTFILFFYYASAMRFLSL